LIISKTPYRVSLFGGGTDYPSWYKTEGGFVVNTTINKYCFITVRRLPRYFSYRHRIRYFQTEEVNDFNEIKHPVVREVCKYFNVDFGIEVVHSGDIPARSGVGSSSSFTVGMIKSIAEIQKIEMSKFELARSALHVEQTLVQEVVGSQDQIAATYGGLNGIKFGRACEAEFDVLPISTSSQLAIDLEASMLLCFTGISRNASEIAEEKVKQFGDKGSVLREIGAIARESFDILVKGTGSIEELGKLLDFQWSLKKSLAPVISNCAIDDLYLAGKKAGAVGAKLLGAGGGGFMLFLAPPRCHNRIKQALNTCLFIDAKFDSAGTAIIFDEDNDV